MNWIIAKTVNAMQYSISTLIPFFTFPSSTSDLLGYYAAFISTIGTAFLGAIAVCQNYIINEKQGNSKSTLENKI